MNLLGRTVRIIIHKPEDWGKVNLFGTIVSDRGGQKLLVRLNKKIIFKNVSGNILELQPLTEGETFKPLGQYSSVLFNGSLKCEEAQSAENIFNGSVTID